MKRKILAWSVIAMILGATVLPIMPVAVPRVEAAVPTFETNPAVTGAEVTQASQSLLEWASKFLLAALKKRLLDMMVDQIIQWVQGGGKPQFVTNWNQFLSDAGNVVGGQFVQALGAGILCGPFNPQILIGLKPVDKFTQRASCTLDQIVGNINNYYTNFRNGGWIAYTAASNPRNNYFGSLVIAEAELVRVEGNAEASALAEALAGNGFISMKKCDANGQNCTITNPGKTIGDTVSKAVGSDIDYLVNAEELSAYVASIANAVINRVITSGVQGLQGLTTPNAPSSGSTNISGCAGLSGAALAACLNYSTGTTNSFTSAKASLINQINQSLTPRQDASTAYADSIARLTQYQSDLQNILSLISPLTCINKASYTLAINDEIQFASSTIVIIQNDLALNKATVDELVLGKAQAQNLVQNDWAGFTTVQSQLSSSSALDPGAALTVKTDAEADNQNIRSRISQNIQAFNHNLASCQLGI